MNDLEAARALGWASVAIAATEIAGQGAVEHELIGIDEHPQLMRALGARELAAGVTILSQKSVTPTLAAGLWSRVAGDAMDLALLALAGKTTRKPGALAASTAMVLGITALDVIYALRISQRLAEAGATAHAAAGGSKTPTTRRFAGQA